MNKEIDHIIAVMIEEEGKSEVEDLFENRTEQQRNRIMRN
jgi:hypothetical protein